MISVPEAESIILNHLIQPGIQVVDLEVAIGHVLGEEIHADRDFPPFDRVTMDGIAIASERFQESHREFSIEGMQAAGQEPKNLLSPNSAIEVMTGALLPGGTDSVIRYEDLEMDEGTVRVLLDQVTKHQNVHRKASDVAKGQILLSPGILMSAAEIALLAASGKKKVGIRTLPPIAIISTGNELVDVDAEPLPWQIRKSNSHALQAALRAIGFGSSLFHLPDVPAEMEMGLEKIMAAFSVIILSGGVSKGKFDFVPQVLEKLGIRRHFHQVSQKPGKPFWFGSSSTHTVFALPGNPVSTYLCFYRYILPWINQCRGVKKEIAKAILAQDYQFNPSLTYFLQVATRNEEGQLLATPVEGGGSGDFANLRDVTGFLELPSEKSYFRKGEVYSFISFR